VIVTLFCDASWCPESRAAGWGTWIKSDRVPVGHQYSGAFMVPCDSSNEAEAMATVNSLFHGIRGGVIEAGDVILFQIDSLRALQVIGWKQLPVTATKNERDAFYRLDAMRRSHRLTYRTRHVKGHQRPTSGTRSQVNNLCDRAARKHMEELREKLAAGYTWPLLRVPSQAGAPPSEPMG